MCSTLSVTSLRITNCSTVRVTTVWLSTVPLMASQVCLVNCSTDNVTTVCLLNCSTDGITSLPCQLFHWQCHNSLPSQLFHWQRHNSLSSQLFHWQCHNSLTVNCSTDSVTTVCLVNCSTDNVTTVCLVNCSTDGVTTVCQLFHWRRHKPALSTVRLTVSQQSVKCSTDGVTSLPCQLFDWRCHNSLPCQLFHWQCHNSLPCQLFHWRRHNSLSTVPLTASQVCLVNCSTDGVTTVWLSTFPLMASQPSVNCSIDGVTTVWLSTVPLMASQPSDCQLFHWWRHNCLVNCLTDGVTTVWLSTVPLTASQQSVLSTVWLTVSQPSDCQLFHWRLHNSLSCQLFLRQIADSCSHKPGGRSCILCSKGGSNPQLTALPPSLQATGSCERKTEGRRKKGRKSSNGKRTSSQAPDVAAALCAPPPLTCPLWWKMSEFRGSSSSALAKQSMASLFKSFWISKLPFLIKALAATCHVQQKEPVQVSIITTPSVQQSKRGTVEEWSAHLAWEQAASGLNLGLSTDPPSTDISPPWPYLPPPFWLVHTHTHTQK